MSCAVGTLLQGPWSAAKGEALASSYAFLKLFQSALDSSLWRLPDSVFKVAITMMLMAGPDGIVRADAHAIAARARVTLRKAEFAIEKLAGPDPSSRDETSGERIRKVPGGWLVINYEHYRMLRDEDKRREQNRLAQQRRRDKEGGHVSIRHADVSIRPADVSSRQQPSAASAHVEGEADVEEEADAEGETHHQQHDGLRTGSRPADVPQRRTLAPEAETVRRIFGGRRAAQ